MKARHCLVLALVVIAGRPLSALGQAQDSKPRGWTAFYAGSSNYAGAGGGLNASRYGISFGSDMEVAEGVLAGGSISLGRQHFSAPDSSGDSDDLFLGLYGRKILFGNGYLLGSALLGWHDVATSRQVGLVLAQAKVNARELGGHVEAGYRWWLDSVYSAAPFFALGAQTIHTPAYRESASSLLGMFVQDHAAYDSDIAHTELGVRIGRTFDISRNRLWVETTLGWAHEIDDTPLAQTVFLGVGGFTVSTILPARETALLGLNLQAEAAGGLSYGARFDSQVGGNTTALSGTANIAWRW